MHTNSFARFFAGLVAFILIPSFPLVQGQVSASAFPDDELELTAAEKKAIEFDAGNKEPILLFDQSASSGLRFGTTRTPYIQVFADGRVVTGGMKGLSISVEHKLSSAELTELLHFVVNQNKAYGLDTDQIKHKVDTAAKRVIVNNGIFTKLRLDLKQGKKEIAIYALSNLETEFGDWVELQRMANIRDRLTRMNATIHLKGEGDILSIVNQELGKIAGDAAPFSMQELILAQKLTKDRFQARFTRVPKEKGKTQVHAVFFRLGKDAEPKVTFYGLPKTKQKKN